MDKPIMAPGAESAGFLQREQDIWWQTPAPSKRQLHGQIHCLLTGGIEISPEMKPLYRAGCLLMQRLWLEEAADALIGPLTQERATRYWVANRQMSVWGEMAN